MLKALSLIKKNTNIFVPKESVVKALSTKSKCSLTKISNPEAMEAPGKKNIKNAILVSGVRTLYFFMFFLRISTFRPIKNIANQEEGTVF